MPDEDTKDRPKSRLWVKITLAVSLSVNLLIVGAVVGAVIAHRGGESDTTKINLRDIAYSPYTRALSREDRKSIGVMMRKELGADRENIPKLRKNFQDLLQALRADTYDDGKVRGLIAEQQDYVTTRQQLGQRLMLDRFGAMSPRERRQFANRLERALSRMRL